MSRVVAQEDKTLSQNEPDYKRVKQVLEMHRLLRFVLTVLAQEDGARWRMDGSTLLGVNRVQE